MYVCMYVCIILYCFVLFFIYYGLLSPAALVTQTPFSRFERENETAGQAGRQTDRENLSVCVCEVQSFRGAIGIGA